MANNKQRYVNTRLWNDTYVSRLDPIEKLLFIYFLTNEHTNISGIYEVPLKVIAIETGIEVSMIEKILPRLRDRIGYVDGYVVVKNFIKHQETGSDLVRKGIVNCLKELRKDFLEDLVNKGFYEIDQYYIDTLSIQYAKVLNYSNLDSNLDLDSIALTKSSKTTKFKKPDIEEIRAYLATRKTDVDAYRFFNYYESNGWRVGKNPMKDWQAAIRTWEKNSIPSTIHGGSIDLTKKTNV